MWFQVVTVSLPRGVKICVFPHYVPVGWTQPVKPHKLIEHHIWSAVWLEGQWRNW